MLYTDITSVVKIEIKSLIIISAVFLISYDKSLNLKNAINSYSIINGKIKSKEFNVLFVELR